MDIELFKHVICKGHDYTSNKILVEIKLPAPIQGISKKEIISYGRDIKNMLNHIYGADISRPHRIRFYIKDLGIFNWEMDQIKQLRNKII